MAAVTVLPHAPFEDALTLALVIEHLPRGLALSVGQHQQPASRIPTVYVGSCVRSLHWRITSPFTALVLVPRPDSYCALCGKRPREHPQPDSIEQWERCRQFIIHDRDRTYRLEY